MKKSILIFGAVFFLANISIAQNGGTDFRETLQLGLKIGTNYAKVYDTQGEEFRADGKFGLAMGAFIAIPIGPIFGVQPEILLSQKGFKATGVILGSTYEMTRTTTYLDIPLLFALKPAANLTLLAGPQYSYLLKQRDVFKNGSSSIAQEEEFENDNIRKNIFGFILGPDFNLNHLVLSGRLGWDIVKNNGDGTTTTPRYKNVWYQVTIGYRFYTQ